MKAINKIQNGFEAVIYVISCVLMLGTPWILKIIIKQAIIETQCK